MKKHQKALLIAAALWVSTFPFSGFRICGDTGSGFAGEIADETVFHQRINE